MPEILEFIAFRNSGKIFQQFSRDFPGAFLDNPRTDPRNSHSLLEFSEKKEPKPKLFGPDIFRWGRGLPREGVGAKKFGMSLETREIKLFGRDIPGFCWDIPELPEKFEKQKVCVQFLSPSFASNFPLQAKDF